ncbi:MAG: hypothetical protein OXC99_07710 [Chloroflexi bacterium]|nr:hypothetical protein [Chloroflexota bacterium]
MATRDRDSGGQQEFLTQTNARFDSVDGQMNDLQAQLAQLAEQLERLIELITEDTDIQKRKLRLLEAAQRSQN